MNINDTVANDPSSTPRLVRTVRRDGVALAVSARGEPSVFYVLQSQRQTGRSHGGTQVISTALDDY